MGESELYFGSPYLSALVKSRGLSLPHFLPMGSGGILPSEVILLAILGGSLLRIVFGN